MVIGNMFLRPYGNKRQSRALVVGSSLHDCLEEFLKIFQCGYTTHLTRLDKRVVDNRNLYPCMAAKTQRVSFFALLS